LESIQSLRDSIAHIRERANEIGKILTSRVESMLRKYYRKWRLDKDGEAACADDVREMFQRISNIVFNVNILCCDIKDTIHYKVWSFIDNIEEKLRECEKHG